MAEVAEQENAPTVAAYLEALGSSAPTPGGGAASALAAALAAALTEMVAQLTVGRPKYAAVEDQARAALEQTRQARADLLDLMNADEQAYLAVAAAYRLPKETDDERARRAAAVQVALRDAMQPPLRMMRKGCDILVVAGEMARMGNATVASDAGCAAVLAEAAVRAAGLNVLANVVLLHDQSAATAMRAQVRGLEERAASLYEQAAEAVRARMGL